MQVSCLRGRERLLNGQKAFWDMVGDGEIVGCKAIARATSEANSNEIKAALASGGVPLLKQRGLFFDGPSVSAYDLKDDFPKEEIEFDRNCLNIVGPTIKIVVLSADGTILSETVDMTPKENKIGLRVGGDLAFIGEYSELDVLLVKTSEERGEPNKHKLLPPLDQTGPHVGDIIMVKFDQNSTPLDFTIHDYTDFITNISEEVTLKRNQQSHSKSISKKRKIAELPTTRSEKETVKRKHQSHSKSSTKKRKTVELITTINKDKRKKKKKHEIEMSYK